MDACKEGTKYIYYMEYGMGHCGTKTDKRTGACEGSVCEERQEMADMYVVE